RGESVKVELVFAHVGVDVQLDIAAWRRQLLPRLACHCDDVADPSDVQHHEIRTGPSHNSAEMSDHLIAALANPRLRAWHSAIAIASRAGSSRRPSGLFICADRMRA